MFDRFGQQSFARCLAVLGVIFFIAAGAAAQSGGFVDSATSAGLRPQISSGQSQTFLPERGPFTFPSPYNTAGIRLTNGGDCGGGDCVLPVGYSYWSNINNHAGSDTMLVFLGLERRRGGGGPTLFSVNKRSGETRTLGPLFSPDSPYSWGSGEGWYFSRTRQNTLYMNDGPRMLRYDVASKSVDTVFDVSAQYGNKVIWQMHSSNDDRVHSATLRDGGSYQSLGCIAYQEDQRRFSFFPSKGDFDECQIDKSGRWLVIKENLDGKNGEDNRIIDLQTGVERVLYDENGAAGHSDVGYGYLVAEDNFNAQPGAVRVWRFDRDVSGGQPAAEPGQGTLVYQLSSWSSGLGHVAHGNSRGGVAPEQQVACASNASRQSLPRVNEIVCFRLDGSLNALVVAPNLTDLNASGGGGEDYNKMPKGNLDPTGEYFIWTANAGSGRLDAYIVKVPVERLGGTPVASTPPPSSWPAPAPSPTPAPSPSPAPSTVQPVRWTNAVNVSVSDNNLRKTGGCQGCADAAATAEQLIGGDGGAVQFVVDDPNGLRLVGLSSGGSGSPAEIEFGLRVQGGVAEVREAGGYKAETRVGSGDVLTVATTGGTVSYVKNGNVFYTSARPPAYPMAAGALLFDINSTVTNAVIRTGS